MKQNKMQWSWIVVDSLNMMFHFWTRRPKQLTFGSFRIKTDDDILTNCTLWRSDDSMKDSPWLYLTMIHSKIRRLLFVRSLSLSVWLYRFEEMVIRFKNLITISKLSFLCTLADGRNLFVFESKFSEKLQNFDFNLLTMEAKCKKWCVQE